MHKYVFALILLVALLAACPVEGPPPSMNGVGFVTLGDSLTMGTQDAGLSREIMDQFLEIHERGTTLLVATHDESLPTYCGKNRLVLDRGRLVQDG